MASQVHLIEEVIEVGPRRVTKSGNRAAVYLGRKLNDLIGRDVIIIVKVLRDT